MTNRKELAVSIPEEICEKIYQNGAEDFVRVVYRAAKYGTINNIAFLHSVDEYKYENRRFNKNLNEIGSYSTSCYITDEAPKAFIGSLKKKYFDKYPCPSVIKGHTLGGLSQRTVERISNHPDENHFDWWIYRDEIESIIKDFSIVEYSEEE